MNILLVMLFYNNDGTAERKIQNNLDCTFFVPTHLKKEYIVLYFFAPCYKVKTASYEKFSLIWQI